MEAMFRGISKETEEWVFGYYAKIEGMYCIFTKDSEFGFDCNSSEPMVGTYEVHPNSIAMNTTVCDKNKKAVYGSIKIDGKMSRGGDIVKSDEIGFPYNRDNVIFSNGAFGLQHWWTLSHYKYLEIIGNQWEVNNES